MFSPPRFKVASATSESIVGSIGQSLLTKKRGHILERDKNAAIKRENSPDASHGQQPSPLERFDADESKEEEEEIDDSPKFKIVNTGAIQFSGIPIPPSAPTNLICEECEKDIAVLHCRLCKEVFCIRCATLCHPPAYGSEFHPHEVSDPISIRAVEFGDTSSVKIVKEFHLPNIEFHEEEYILRKDLTKPQSLAAPVSNVAPKTEPAAPPKYKVHDVMLFTDPHSEREAHGLIVSEWDFRHGDMATPAVIRGDDSTVYYIVQMQGFKDEVENVASLIQKPPKVEKIENFPIIHGIENHEMREHLMNAHKVNKKVVDIEGVRRLGPKHHLRDVVTYNTERDRILLESRDYGILPSQLTKQREQEQQLQNQQQQITGSISAEGTGTGAGASSVVGELSTAYNLRDDSSASLVGSVTTSTASKRTNIPNKNRRIRMGSSNEYVEKERDFGEQLYEGLDMSLYADIDTDVQSELSFGNPLGRPSPAYCRSYADIVPVPAAATADGNTTTTASQSSAAAGGAGRGIASVVESPASSNMSEQLKFTQVPSEYDVKFNPGDYYSRQLYSAGSVLRKNRLKKDKLSVRTDRIGKRRISKFAADRTMNRRRKSVEDRDFDSDSDGGGEDDQEDEDDRYSEEEEEALEEEEDGSCSPVDIFTRNALKIIVLSEKDIITVQEYLEMQRERKEELMKKVWHHLKGSEKQSMKLFGFHRWQENTNLLRDNEAHKSAIILQALARMYLARNVLDVKTDEWFQRQEDKRKALHAQFRYSTPDYKWAVTMDKKIYFETVTDLNRYAQFLRLTMYKVGKYLVRKRGLLLAMAMKKWRQGMATFLESDIASSHVNDVAIDFSSTNPADQYGNLVAQRDQITFNHLLLQEKAAEVTDLTLPKEYVDEMGYETVVSLPWRLPVVPDIGEAPIRTHASNEQKESVLLIENGESKSEVDKEKDSKNAVQEGVADNSERPLIGSRNGGSSRSRQSSRGEGRGGGGGGGGGGGMEGATTANRSDSNSRPGSRASNTSRGGGGGGRTMSRESSRGHLSRQSSRRRRRRRSSSRGATPNSTTGKFTPERSRPASRNTDRSTTPADTSRKRGVANGQQQQGGGEDTFEEWEDDSEYEYYYSDDDEFYDGEEGFEEPLSAEELQRRAEEEAVAAAAVEAEWKASMHSLVPSYFPAEGMQLPPLPQMFIPHTAEERLHLKNERRLNYCAFREHMMGPTFDSNWVLPSILCMGCMPWGPADTSNLEYPEFEPAVKPSMFSLKSTRTQETSTTTTTTTTPSGEGIIIKEEEGEGEKEMDPVERSRKQLQAVKVWKPPTVTAVSTLLLNGIDCFVSLMEPEEEEAVEVACRVPPMEEVIQTSLKQSSSAVATIISQCTENIRRKQKQLDDIPVYGKTDPRFKMVYREQLRCKARIQLEQDKMAKARSQVRNLAPHVFFERIAMSRDGESITANEVFPKLWHLEHLLKEGRKIYLYSRDGHGRAGMVAAMLVGRLYHLNTHEALYRVQAMHDSAKREAGRKIPINCPQLPAQRDLVTEVLNLTNRIQHPTYVRTQIDPETFFERFPTNPYYYQGAVDASKQRKKDTNAQRDQNQNLEQETGSVGSLGSRQDSSKSIQLVEKPKPIRKWKSLQTQEETALEAAEDRLARELGDNAQVLKKEKQFLDQLYAPENQRRKQTITLSVDGDYVFEGSDIVYRGPATSTAAAGGGGGVERDGIPAAGHASLLSPTTKQRLGSSKHGATASAKINHSIRRVERGGGGGGGSHTSAKKSSTTGGVDAATATAAANDADMSNAADGDAEEDAAGTASHSTGRSRKADSSASSGGSNRRSAFRGSKKENKAPLAVETQYNPQIPTQERRNRGGGITVRSQEGILNDSSVTTTAGTTGTPLPITTTTTTTTAANRSSSGSSFGREGEPDHEQDEGDAMIDPRLRAEPKLPELYDRSVFGQSVDVARKLPVRRPSPAAFPLLPLLRHTNARTPQPKLVPTRHNTPATGLNHTGANIMRQQQQRRGMSSSSSSSSSSAAAAAVTATTATAAAATSSCSSSSSNGKDFISLPVNNHTMSSSSGMMEGGATTTTNTGTLYLKNSSS